MKLCHNEVGWRLYSHKQMHFSLMSSKLRNINMEKAYKIILEFSVKFNFFL